MVEVGGAEVDDRDDPLDVLNSSAWTASSGSMRTQGVERPSCTWARPRSRNSGQYGRTRDPVTLALPSSELEAGLGRLG